MIIGYVLLALGVAVFVLSFMIPVKKEESREIEFSEDMIRNLVGKEVETAKNQLNDIVDETISYAMEKTERSMDRLTNEKMMAVNEYSDTVLSEINKNHKEVVFLYDMLNDKHENLKDTVSEMDKKSSEVKQAVRDAEISAREAKQQLEEAKEQAFSTAKEVENVTRMSAIERLKMIQPEPESVKEEVEFVPFSAAQIEVIKPERKKRTTKPKVREEAVSFGEPQINVENGPELIQSGEGDVSKIRKDAPNLNLGTDVAGKAMGGRNNNERILELHNMGKSNMAIAKELGLGVGEVKLVIDLFEGM